MSDDSLEQFIEESHGTKEDFYLKVKKEVDALPRNSIICFDDQQDSEINQTKVGGLQRLLDKMLRTGRHLGKSTITLNHLINSGYMGRQLTSSVKWRVLFPRSSKHKIVRWLNERTDMPLSDARRLVSKIASESRWMAVHVHSPQAVVSEKYVKLL